MTHHLHGVTNIVVLPTPSTIMIAFGTDAVEFGEQTDSQVSARIKPQWDQVVSIGHGTAKQLLLILAEQIRVIEAASGEIKIPQAPQPGSSAKN